MKTFETILTAVGSLLTMGGFMFVALGLSSDPGIAIFACALCGFETALIAAGINKNNR